VWTASAGWVDLGSPHTAGCGADEVSAAFDISADGKVVVGMTWNGCTPDAFRWSDASGTGTFATLEVLGTPSPGSTNPPTNRATVISDDGTVAAGFAQNGGADRSPALWLADGSGEMLDPANTDVPGEVLAIDADGTTLAGNWGYDGFVWTRSGGVTWLPRLDISLPSDPIYPNATDASGTLVFGGIGNAFFSIPTAFVWSAAAGTRALADIAAAGGVPVPEGVVLNSVLGASSDGTVLIGTATDADFALKTFVLRLPATAFE
jgi:probable HAF family extracellular repeat protein